MIADNVEMPVRGTKESAGYDFYAPRDIELTPGKWERVDTRVKLDGTEKIITPSPGRNGKIVHKQWFMMIAPRSSMSMKYGLRFINIPPIIDQDFIKKDDWIIVEMTVNTHCIIKKGERFAQGIFVPYGILEGEETPRKERDGGIGSTGA